MPNNKLKSGSFLKVCYNMRTRQYANLGHDVVTILDIRVGGKRDAYVNIHNKLSLTTQILAMQFYLYYIIHYILMVINAR